MCLERGACSKIIAFSGTEFMAYAEHYGQGA